MKYKVIRGVTSDKKEKHYPSGEILTGSEFPKKVITNWVKTGVLKEIGKTKEEIEEEDLFDLSEEDLHIEDGE